MPKALWDVQPCCSLGQPHFSPLIFLLRIFPGPSQHNSGTCLVPETGTVVEKSAETELKRYKTKDKRILVQSGMFESLKRALRKDGLPKLGLLSV